MLTLATGVEPNHNSKPEALKPCRRLTLATGSAGTISVSHTFHEMMLGGQDQSLRLTDVIAVQGGLPRARTSATAHIPCSACLRFELAHAGSCWLIAEIALPLLLCSVSHASDGRPQPYPVP